MGFIIGFIIGIIFTLLTLVIFSKVIIRFAAKRKVSGIVDNVLLKNRLMKELEVIKE